MSGHFRTAFMMLLVLPVCAQQQTTAPAKQTVKKTAPAPKHLTVDDVLAMVKAGLSDDVVIARLRKDDKPFDLSPDDLIRLKQAKVSDPVLKVMMDPKADTGPTAQQTQQAPRTVVTQRPVFPGILAANSSGATPAPGASTTGDQNDPLIPHDSGIYLYTKDHEGRPQMIVLERAAYNGAKTGGMLGSAMTYGIKKAKTKAVISGTRASIRVTDPSPTFYFYFDDKQAGLGKTYFGIGSLSSPNQFVLLKLEVKKSDRETTIGQYSALGMSSGSDSNATIPFKFDCIRAGLYKVVVDSLKAGEYCFLASSGSAQPTTVYGAGAANGADIFDFGVSVE